MMKNYAQKCMAAILDAPDNHVDSSEMNAFADQQLCIAISAEMSQKLRISREKGRGGWWNPDECSTVDLKHMMIQHIEKGDMIDVINFAAMLHMRQSVQS